MAECHRVFWVEDVLRRVLFEKMTRKEGAQREVGLFVVAFRQQYCDECASRMICVRPLVPLNLRHSTCVDAREAQWVRGGVPPCSVQLQQLVLDHSVAVF